MACDIELAATAVSNDPCSKLLLGKQPVGFFYQDSAAATVPELVAVGGNLAAFQAALSATGALRVFKVGSLAAGVRPEATDQTLTGNDVPYGGTELTDRANTITGRLQYMSAADITATDQMNKRGGTVRVWVYDELGMIQGPIENVSVVYGALQRPGLGQNIGANRAVTLSWNAIEEAPLSTAPKTFLKGLVNAAPEA